MQCSQQSLLLQLLEVQTVQQQQAYVIAMT